MRHAYRIVAIVLVATAFTASNLVRGETVSPTPDRGAFVGFSAGAALWNYDPGYLDTMGLDDEDLGWRIFAGYQFTRHFALAGEWVDLGRLGGDFSGAEAYGAHLVAQGLFPVADRHVLSVQLGAFDWTEGYSYSDPNGTYGHERSGTSASFGAGYTGYVVGRRLGLQVEWIRFFSVGTPSVSFGEPADLDLVSVGLIWNFR